MTFQQLLVWPRRPSPTLCFCVGQTEVAQTAGRRPQLLGDSKVLDQPIQQALIQLLMALGDWRVFSARRNRIALG